MTKLQIARFVVGKMMPSAPVMGFYDAVYRSAQSLGLQITEKTFVGTNSWNFAAFLPALSEVAPSLAGPLIVI
jgi:hypothetical protein